MHETDTWVTVQVTRPPIGGTSTISSVKKQPGEVQFTNIRGNDMDWTGWSPEISSLNTSNLCLLQDADGWWHPSPTPTTSSLPKETSCPFREATFGLCSALWKIAAWLSLWVNTRHLLQASVQICGAFQLQINVFQGCREDSHNNYDHLNMWSCLLTTDWGMAQLWSC